MKKLFPFMLVLMLAVPGLSHGGSATSRWDMAIGGFVKFDLGWSDRMIGADYRTAPRNDFRQQDALAKSSANLYWAGGETRLNFAVAGPDAWAAKTSAFIEGDFRGITGSGNGAYNVPAQAVGDNYGLFTLRHAYMTFKWPKTTLLLGHTWQAWGYIPSATHLGTSENHFMKGYTRIPQIRLTQSLTRNFTLQVAAASGSSNQLTAGGSNYWNENTSSLLPHFSGELQYSTDACGKIGAFPLRFGLGGFVSRDQYFFINNPANVAPYTIDKESVTTYGGSFYWYIPIIPEKKGNKATALGFTGNIFAGKGMGLYLPAYPGALSTDGAYNRYLRAAVSGTAINAYAPVRELQEPNTWGAWGQLTFYFTDKLFTNVLYGFQNNALSYGYAIASAANGNMVKYIDNWIVNFMYDVSPAIRLAMEYTHVKTTYAAVGGNVTNAAGVTNGWNPLDRSGDMNTVRFGLYYFF